MVDGGRQDSPSPANAREQQQQRIIAAAIKCFARSGFHGASMKEICAEAGMSAGNLYRYFRNKEAIIAVIADTERERNAALFDELNKAEDPVVALIELAGRYFADMAEREAPALCMEIIVEALRNPNIRTLFQRNIDEAHAAFAAALHRGTECGLVDPALDIDIVVRFLIALGDGIVAHRPMTDFMTDDRMGPMLTLLIERFLRPPPTR
jgi:TetR/AcrR family transcriptional regulator, repressor for uid operon